jgi:hypothetical protein
MCDACPIYFSWIFNQGVIYHRIIADRANVVVQLHRSEVLENKFVTVVVESLNFWKIIEHITGRYIIGVVIWYCELWRPLSDVIVRLVINVVYISGSNWGSWLSACLWKEYKTKSTKGKGMIDNALNDAFVSRWFRDVRKNSQTSVK